MQHLDNDLVTTIDRRTGIGTTRGYTLAQFQALQKGSISGTVTELGTGVPLGDVAVFIYDINGDERAQVTTNASGQYLVENFLQPGRYRATTQNTLSFIDEIYDNIRCAGSCGSPDRNGTPILVETGLETTAINFALSN